MGPSGCGKTTLLNVLARRAASSGAKTTGNCRVNGGELDNATFGRITSYVEQEDALIGSLTVKETLKFAADLSLPGYDCACEYEVSRYANGRGDLVS
jgi:ABC-type multidrug transport system ATPase subunit